MQQATSHPNVLNRRTVLRTAGAVALAGAALGSARPVRAQSAAAADFDAWFADVDNFAGVVDHTGETEVRIAVGATGNGGAFGFEPAAVRVDPGTTIVWEWTGEGGVHNVAAEDGSYESDMLATAGATFEHVFEAEGVSLYACAPHKAMGMKGAIVIGDVDVGAVSMAAREPDYGDWFDGVDNFTGTVDATGKSEVRIAVGAEGNGGAFAFEPAAVMIDPGTTVVWEWTGRGGVHNVYDDDIGYESEFLSAEGATFALTFDGRGISKYVCAPHEAMGMRGAIVVGTPPAGAAMAVSPELAVGGAVAAALLSPFAYGLVLLANGVHREKRPRRGDRSTAERIREPAEAAPDVVAESNTAAQSGPDGHLPADD
jgi:halocyanin-like protein